MKNASVNIDGAFEKYQVIGFLEDLVSSLRRGEIVFEKDGDIVTLNPESSLGLKVNASSESKTEKMLLELNWHKV